MSNKRLAGVNDKLKPIDSNVFNVDEVHCDVGLCGKTLESREGRKYMPRENTHGPGMTAKWLNLP